MGEEGICPLFCDKVPSRLFFGRLRRVKCKIPPPEKPDCRHVRFVVRHIYVVGGGGKPIRAAWALYEAIMTT